MKEHNLKELLSKPVMDQKMEKRIVSSILQYEDNIAQNKERNKSDDCKCYNRKNRKNIIGKANYNISRFAFVIIGILIIGTGTAYAASLYVKSYRTNIKFMTENELSEAMEHSDVTVFETIEKKVFGEGNVNIIFSKDSNGKFLEMDEEGYLTLEDGTKYKPPYKIHKNRHELDKINGDEAFSYAGFQNITPTYLYENYLLSERGYSYSELKSIEDNITRKDIIAEFFPDYYLNDNSLKRIWVTFSTDNMERTEHGVIHTGDDASNFTL